jgi:hypothetical protein
VMAAPDPKGRLRLCLVDRTAGRSDATWRTLRDNISASWGAVPYKLDQGGRADDAGIRGECWITIPKGRGPDRVLGLARELSGKEVRLDVVPKRFSFVSRAAHNRGEQVVGTSLQFDGGLEEIS